MSCSHFSRGARDSFGAIATEPGCELLQRLRVPRAEDPALRTKPARELGISIDLEAVCEVALQTM